MFQKITLAITAVLFVYGSSALANEMAPGTVFSDCDGCPEMVVVPAGEFMMGASASDSGPIIFEGPQHSVVIPSAFAVGRSEVTVGEFRLFVSDTGHSTRGACWIGGGAQQRPTESRSASWQSPGHDQTERHPVVCVNWNDAVEYANWLSSKTGHSYRLISEAEWEYVAQTGVNSHDALEDDASRQETNQIGLLGMTDNGSEWVQDCWNPTYSGAPVDGSAWSSGRCSYRVLRGDPPVANPRGRPSIGRLGVNKRGRQDTRGFRVARDLTSAETVSSNEEETEQ